MSTQNKRKVLVTGALGQIGTELTPALRDRYGDGNVVSSDIRSGEAGDASSEGLFEPLDVLSVESMNSVIEKHGINVIYHLAAVLSAVAEGNPQRAWEINMGGLYNALEAARRNGCSLFVPSSIGAFGPTTPMDNTPQETIMRPRSMYGVTKVSGELLCDYYHMRYGVDARGIRYPGIISSGAPPGGGTTDYAVEIYYEAVRNKRYCCPLREDTSLDMMYMPDAIRAAIDLMEVDPARLKHRNAFNVTAMHFTPGEIAAEIRKHIPEFEMTYDIDPVRQEIADSWPNSMDDSAARDEWDWKPHYDLSSMTADMLKNIKDKKGKGMLEKM